MAAAKRSSRWQESTLTPTVLCWSRPPRLKGDAEQHRNKANTTRNKNGYLNKIRGYPQFAQKPIGTITKKDCDQVLRLLEKGCTRVYQRATLKPGAKAYKTMSCPKIAEFCTIKEETVGKVLRGGKRLA